MLKALEALYENGNIRILDQKEKGIYKAIIVLVERIQEDTQKNASLKKYAELASDFDFGLKADSEYAQQLLDEHKELIPLRLETEKLLEQEGYA